jgi:hypothetical protein
VMFRRARPGADSLRYEDGLGEFEIRLLFEQLLGDDSAAALLASGWAGDRYQVFGDSRGGGKRDVLVWYTLWADRASAARFFAGLERAWGKRRAGGGADRRSDIKRLIVDGVPAVRLVDAPAAWTGWHNVPRVSLRAKAE